MEKLDKRVARLKVGPPMADVVDVGPLGMIMTLTLSYVQLDKTNTWNQSTHHSRARSKGSLREQKKAA